MARGRRPINATLCPGARGFSVAALPGIVLQDAAVSRGGSGMWSELRRDSARYAGLGGWYKHPGFWVGATYRFGVWAHGLPAALRIPLVALYRVVKIPWVIFLRANLSAGARIGPGLCLVHPYSVLVPDGVEIGEDCLVFHEVTFGTGPTAGLPRVGNAVDVYVGARILGGITVGDGCMLGANCVLTRSVPPGQAVLAPPAQILPRTLLARAAPASAEPPAPAPPGAGATR